MNIVENYSTTLYLFGSSILTDLKQCCQISNSPAHGLDEFSQEKLIQIIQYVEETKRIASEKKIVKRRKSRFLHLKSITKLD